MPSAERHQIISFLHTLPTSLDIEVNGGKFHLVHGFPSPEVDDQLWKRPTIHTPNPFSDGRTVIIGHTPVAFLLQPEKVPRANYLNSLESFGEHLRILHTEGFIDIDCGCGNLTAARRLACIRLDDMKEFYT